MMHPPMKNLQDGNACIVFNDNWRLRMVANYLTRFRGRSTAPLVVEIGAFKSHVRGFHVPTGSLIQFSREEMLGDRAFHLTLTFYKNDSKGNPTISIDDNQVLTEEWIRAFFGHHREWVWCQPPINQIAKVLDVWHYRLFVNKSGDAIPVPNPEEFLKAGWRDYPGLAAQRRQISRTVEASVAR